MTALIGGSVLLIAGSAVALVIGWISADATLIWASIVASVVAAVLLALGYYRARAATRVPRRAESGGAGEDVVAVPDRKRYHRPDCRHAKVEGAEPMTRSQARSRGYDACGVCKP